LEKYRKIADSCGSESDLMSYTPGTPCSAASSGTVVSDSTWSGDSPRQFVWTSTETGANSGNTSSF
jgi:hypothetical protein